MNIANSHQSSVVTNHGSIDTTIDRQSDDVFKDGDNKNKSIEKLETESMMCRPQTPMQQSWLLRLFESKLFNMNIAITYLFNSKESGVLSYLGNRMFTFPTDDVDFFLPQLIVLYIHNNNIADAIHPYLIHRCRQSVYASTKCIWLLNAFCPETQSSTITLMLHSRRNKSLGHRLRKSILNEEFRLSTADFNQSNDMTNSNYMNHSSNKAKISHNHHRTHYRSFSDAMTKSQLSGINLSQTEAIIGCIHHQQKKNRFLRIPSTTNGMLRNLNQSEKTFPSCLCAAPRIKPEYEFIRCLMNIGLKMQSVPSKEIKSQLLISELSSLNIQLPARVWIPTYTKHSHMIVRIPPHAAVLLNSKDKAPYLIYFEICECDDIEKSPVPVKQALTNSRSSLNGSSSSINFLMMTNNNHDGNFDSNQKQQCILQSQSFSQNYSASIIRQTKSEENLIEFAMKHGKETIKDNLDEKIPIPCEDSNSNKSNTVIVIGADDDEEEMLMAKQYGAFNVLRRLPNQRQANDNLSQFSTDSTTSNEGILIAAGDIRRRLNESIASKDNNFNKFCPEDPSAAALKEPWDEKVSRIRESSPYGHIKSWHLVAAIIKCGDDLRQEMMVYQILETLKSIWEQEHVPLWLRPYAILSTSPDSGIIEPILNSVSLHQIKKHCQISLLEYFVREFGDGSMSSELFLTARKNFVQSCAAYSIVSYLMQVKDR